MDLFLRTNREKKPGAQYTHAHEDFLDVFVVCKIQLVCEPKEGNNNDRPILFQERRNPMRYRLILDLISEMNKHPS